MLNARPFVLSASLACALAASGQAPSTTSAAPSPEPVVLEFTGVVSIEGATKDQLHSAGLAWFGDGFRSGKAVLDLQDKEAGRLVGKPTFTYSPKVFVGSARIKGSVRYTVTLEVKDGKYRYRIDSFIHEGTPGPGGQPSSFGLLTDAAKCPYPVEGPTAGGKQETWEHLKVVSKAEAEALVASLKKRMADAGKKGNAW